MAQAFEILWKNTAVGVNDTLEYKMQENGIFEQLHWLDGKLLVEYFCLLVVSHEAYFIKPVLAQEVAHSYEVHDWQAGRINETYKDEKVGLSKLIANHYLCAFIELVKVRLSDLLGSRNIKSNFFNIRNLKPTINPILYLVQDYFQKVSDFAGDCLEQHGKTQSAPIIYEPVRIKF